MVVPAKSDESTMTKPVRALVHRRSPFRACQRLAPHQEVIAAREAERRERIDAGRRKLREHGSLMSSELDAHLRAWRPREGYPMVTTVR